MYIYIYTHTFIAHILRLESWHGEKFSEASSGLELDSVGLTAVDGWGILCGAHMGPLVISSDYSPHEYSCYIYIYIYTIYHHIP